MYKQGLALATVITALRTAFFEYLFGEDEGILCICTGNPNQPKGHPENFVQHFVDWPSNKDHTNDIIERAVAKNHNVWYCTSLLDAPSRKKENCLPGRIVWADLDTCHPDKIVPTPSLVVESSAQRFQAIWRLDEIIEPYMQEEYSKRIAYKYAPFGVDKSGWDLTQVLRVPLTFNQKYANNPPEVSITRSLELLVPLEVMEAIERPAENGNTPDSGYEAAQTLPDVAELPPIESVIYKYHTQLAKHELFRSLYSTVPTDDEDWSRSLWRLLNICIEAGMDDTETFTVGMHAACNKYVRDNRPPLHLWQDVIRAAEGQRRVVALLGTGPPIKMPHLVDEDLVTRSFATDYTAWATEATDAVPVYHELAAFILLSSVVAAGCYTETSYGRTVPNLWGLILGDSTLARKTTAMDMAKNIIFDIDRELILATDGSAEGLLSGLSQRPGRVSIFYKDEVSGFFDSINRKDYLAGMPETLTQLYDVPRVLTRMLRKETISVSSPVFIFFGGGIRDKVYTLTSDEYVLSGFLPRFLVVGGEADLTKIRRTGPAINHLTAKRDAIVEHVSNLYEIFSETATMNIGGQPMAIPATTEALLTDEAWARYGEIEAKMVQVAYDSSIPMLALPTFERLSRSLLKMAILLGASRLTEPPQVVSGMRKFNVTEQDIINAASYVQRWGMFSVDLLLNTGRGVMERTLLKILASIHQHPDGITRSALMNKYHLTSRDANEIFTTLEDRGQIVSAKKGRGVILKVVK